MQRNMAQATVPVLVDSFALGGGLDQHTPQSSVQPGFARETSNFECSISGGYTRIPGYERYSGVTSPSSAAATPVNLFVAPFGVAVGDVLSTITGQGTVALIDGRTMVLTMVTGTFEVGQFVVGAASVTIGNIESIGLTGASQSTVALYQAAASSRYRALIQPVPGSGPVRGGFTYLDYNYAWRNSASGTQAVLHRATTTGWVPVAAAFELSFTTGSGVAPVEGGTITQGARSAIVRRILVRTGSFGAGTAAGVIIIDAATAFVPGAFTAGITATCSGAPAAITMLPGGRFQHDIGDAGRGVRVYGCDGSNRAFEFDGVRVVPISTGNAIDAPRCIKVHKHHLFAAFRSSVQHAGPGEPYSWTAVSGASELAVDRLVTGLQLAPGDSTTAALVVFTDKSVHVLYGNSAADWKLSSFRDTGGSKMFGHQALDGVYHYDDVGIMAMTATQAYGNFTSSSLTLRLRSFVQARKTLVSDSSLNREKSQFRVFYADGYGLYMTIVNGKFLGAMPVLYPNPVLVTWGGSSINGGEVSYFGSNDGYVYQNDVGTSFDGQPIKFSLELAYSAKGSDRVTKRYRRCVLELQGVGYCEFSVGYLLGYASPENLQPGDSVVQSNTSSSRWDLFTWDAFNWDGRTIAPTQVRLNGSAENISLRVAGESSFWPEFTINTAAIHYSPRRLLRN